MEETQRLQQDLNKTKGELEELRETVKSLIKKVPRKRVSTKRKK